MNKILMISIFTLALGGCGSILTPEPRGIGESMDDLKRSPCACMEIPQDYSGWTKSS